MAQYLLVLNKEQVILGPFDWKQRYIQSEFDDLYDNGDISFQYQVALIDTGYINVGEGYEIFPIVSPTQPDIDPNFEDPIGPFYTYDNNEATATFSKQDRPIPAIQSTVLSVAASLRYTKEIAGTTANVQNTMVTVDTSRDGRAIFVQAYSTMGDSDVIGWKFPECWLNLTKSDLGVCVGAGVVYVQSQFAWEQNIDNQVNNASTVDDLKNIYNSMFPVSNTANNGIINA